MYLFTSKLSELTLVFRTVKLSQGSLEDRLRHAVADSLVVTVAVEDTAEVVVWACKVAAAAAVAAVRSLSPMFVTCQPLVKSRADTPLQLPYQVGWQDLKDLFRQAGKLSHFNLSCFISY